MTDPLTAWLYARRSRVSDNQASVTDQIGQGRDVIDVSGWQLGEILNEEVSASRYAKREREAWPLLLEALEAGKIGVLVLWESSRGDRKLSEWARFLDACRDSGTLVHVISHERTYDLRNHRDWKTLASEGVDNDHFSQRLSAEVRKGKRGAARRGRPQGAPSYGYRVRYDERTGRPAGWDVIEGRDEVVRRIIRDVGAHVPIRRITSALDAGGVLSPTGGRWVTDTVRNIARNPSYAGLIRLPDGTLTEMDKAWPAIVGRQEWERAQAVLRPRVAGSRPGAAVHMMSFLADGDCGDPIKSAGTHGYRCEAGHMRLPLAWLDEAVGYLVCAKLARDDARDLYADDSDARALELRSELVPLLTRRERYRAAAADGDEDADDILARLKPKIARLERQLGEVRYVPALRDILTADDTFAAWEGYTVQARREVIAAVTGITVLRVPKTATRAQRYDVARVVPDWKPQLLRTGGNRRGRRILAHEG